MYTPTSATTTLEVAAANSVGSSGAVSSSSSTSSSGGGATSSHQLQLQHSPTHSGHTNNDNDNIHSSSSSYQCHSQQHLHSSAESSAIGSNGNVNVNNNNSDSIQILVQPMTTSSDSATLNRDQVTLEEFASSFTPSPSSDSQSAEGSPSGRVATGKSHQRHSGGPVEEQHHSQHHTGYSLHQLIGVDTSHAGNASTTAGGRPLI